LSWSAGYLMKNCFCLFMASSTNQTLSKTSACETPNLTIRSYGKPPAKYIAMYTPDKYWWESFLPLAQLDKGIYSWGLCRCTAPFYVFLRLGFQRLAAHEDCRRMHKSFNTPNKSSGDQETCEFWQSNAGFGAVPISFCFFRQFGFAFLLALLVQSPLPMSPSLPVRL
jgi:hypothetical protein